jgi:DNA-binding NtrC family response regulator
VDLNLKVQVELLKLIFEKKFESTGRGKKVNISQIKI